ncbi:ras association domain-containing protein 8 [Syngnathoides biaculeatus]|uniref:ras association domain-containing protein 8 n=1 Tax=Syngnathoides biaculeatus TaxID=300417 RepID=UPI002ADD6924|nr:ras association domain-containing protein 8 [Syngnathoides biaculeatus]
MEIKVSVDSLPRLVCGVTDETTCQEVVTVLAQALGQPGRYMLRETFKDFERCMAPDEHPLEMLRKYGEHAKEVQLTLLHSGPLVCDEMSRAKLGRHQPCPPLRRKEATTRVWRRSGSLNLHRQSFPLSCLRRDTDQNHEHVKRPKRKSMAFVEEAWEWLENLGKTHVYSTACDKESSKKTGKNKRTFLSVTLSAVRKSPRDQSQVRGHGNSKPDFDQTSCCMGTQQKLKENKNSKKTHGGILNTISDSNSQGEKNHLRETIICQLSYLQKLQVQIECVDKEILELEESEWSREEQKMIQDEMEQMCYWENELKAEEVFETDLQDQFHDMKAKIVDCKAKLEEYKTNMQKLDFCGAQNVDSKEGRHAADGNPPRDSNWQLFKTEMDVNSDRKWPPRRNFNTSPLLPPSQIKERRPTGPTELREWWARWSAVQNSKSNMKKTEIHRSELTIYLGGTKD